MKLILFMICVAASGISFNQVHHNPAMAIPSGVGFAGLALVIFAWSVKGSTK